jgi:hypothetical protein
MRFSHAENNVTRPVKKNDIAFQLSKSDTIGSMKNSKSTTKVQVKKEFLATRGEAKILQTS